MANSIPADLTLSATVYARLQGSLHSIYTEVKDEYPQKATLSNEKLITSANSRDLNLFLENAPAFQLKDVSKKMKQFTKNYLWLMEAACREHVLMLADHFARKWNKKIDKKLSNLFQKRLKEVIREELVADSSTDGYNLTCETWTKVAKVKKKLELFEKKTLWPKFSDPHLAYDFLVSKVPDKDILNSTVIHNHFESILCFARIPRYVTEFFSHTRLNPVELTLLIKYQKQIQTLQVTHAETANQGVKVMLRRFRNATGLDLTDALYAKADCLQSGHPNITHIILNGTSIKEEDIPKEKFPKLVQVEQNEYVKVLDANASRLVDMSLDQFEESVNRAQKIIYPPLRGLEISLTNHQEAATLRKFAILLRNAEKLVLNADEKIVGYQIELCKYVLKFIRKNRYKEEAKKILDDIYNNSALYCFAEPARKYLLEEIWSQCNRNDPFYEYRDIAHKFP